MGSGWLVPKRKMSPAIGPTSSGVSTRAPHQPSPDKSTCGTGNSVGRSRKHWLPFAQTGAASMSSENKVTTPGGTLAALVGLLDARISV